jgi:hypothetical protein
MYYFYKKFNVFNPKSSKFLEDGKFNKEAWKQAKEAAIKKAKELYGEEVGEGLIYSRPRFNWLLEPEVASMVNHLLKIEAALMDDIRPYKGWRFHKIAVKAELFRQNRFTAARRFKPFDLVSQPRLEESFNIAQRILDILAKGI